MSEKTAQELAEAKALEAAKRIEVRELECALLTAVARDVPRHAQALGRSVALAQPDAARALGREGIDALRSDLSARAADVAAGLEAAVDQIKWPFPTSRYSPATASEVQASLLRYVSGPQVDDIAAIFKQRGFADHGRHGSQRLVLPQQLLSEQELAEPLQAVASALTELHAAQEAVAQAKAADDRDAVDSLWD